MGGMGLVALLVLIVIGLLECFFGYKLFRILLGIAGFIVGAFLGALAGYAISPGSTIAPIIGAIAGAIIGAALFVLLYKVGVFLAGAAVGFALGAGIMTLIGQPIDGTVGLVVSIVVAVVIGALAVVLQRAIIILITAFGGSWSVVTAIGSLFGVGSLASGVESMAEDISALVTGASSVGSIGDAGSLITESVATLGLTDPLALVGGIAGGLSGVGIAILAGWVVLGVLGAIVQFKQKE